MKKIIYFPLLAVLALSANAYAQEFRSADIHPEGYPTVKAVQQMAKQLEKVSGGKDTIKVYLSGSLGNEKETVEKLISGELEMTRINISVINNICPETKVLALPFLFQSTAHLHKVLDGDIGKEILRICESKGLVGLAFYDSGARSIYTVKKSIRGVNDLKGLNIRVQQSDLWIAVLSAMGANAVPMSFGEVYEALKTGAIDGAENNWPAYETTKHFEVAKYYSLTEHSMAPEILLFSKKVWDKLTPRQREALWGAAQVSVPYMRRLWDEREAQAQKTIKESGVKILEVDKVSFAIAVKPVYDKFITDAKSKELVARIRKVK